MIYNVWIEGYSITGGGCRASWFCLASGDTFKKACDKAFEGDKYYNKEKRTYWGCKLFDNEYDARRSFG